MSSKRNLRNSVPLYLRLIFSVIFFVYSFVFLYFIQGDLLAEAQYVYSNGLTTYSILFGAIILTVVLLIVSRVMNILFHYPSELYVLSYLPSFLLLSVIASVNIDAFRDFTFGEWIWLFPLVLVVYFILILLIIPKLEHFKRKSSNNYFTKLIWKNSLIFLLLSLLTASVSNTNNVIYYELKAERLILNGKYDDVLEVGAKSLETSRRLTELRMYALAKTGRLCDDLFDYPQYYGVDGLLDISDTTESYYRFSSKNICKSMGAYCDKSVKSSGRYLQLMKEKFSIVDDFVLDTLSNDSLIGNLCKKCYIRNKKIIDSYYLAYLLLDKNLDGVLRYFDNKYVFGDSLPQAVKEALLLSKSFEFKDSLISDTCYYSLVDTATVVKFIDYKLVSDTINDSTERRNRLRRKFGDTFWWYYDYSSITEE